MRIALPVLLRHPGTDPGDLLLGEPGGQKAAALILHADLQAGDQANQGAAIVTLRAATAQTSSLRLREAIGSRANAIASRLARPDAAARPPDATTGIAAAQLATEVLPGNVSAWRSYATALESAARYEDALATWDQVLSVESRDHTARHRRAKMMLGLGRLEEALTAYNQALALDPGDSGMHENKGIVLAATGDFDKALSEFDAADCLAPTGAGEGRTWAGAVLWHQRDTARSRLVRAGQRPSDRTHALPQSRTGGARSLRTRPGRP